MKKSFRLFLLLLTVTLWLSACKKESVKPNSAKLKAPTVAPNPPDYGGNPDIVAPNPPNTDTSAFLSCSTCLP